MGWSIRDLGGADPSMAGSPDNVAPVTDEEISKDSTNKFKSKKEEGEIEEKDFSRAAGPDGPIKIARQKSSSASFHDLG